MLGRYFRTDAVWQKGISMFIKFLEIQQLSGNYVTVDEAVLHDFFAFPLNCGIALINFVLLCIYIGVAVELLNKLYSFIKKGEK